ncbi:hypothetical protein IAR50_007506 [Cryptococcus sp. DSM 104548]
MSYQQVPHEDPSDLPTSYPPLQHIGPPYALARPTKHRITPSLVLKYTLYAVGGLVVFHYVLIGAFPTSRYTENFRQWQNVGLTQDDYVYTTESSSASDLLAQLDPDSGQPGTFFRDAYPLRTMLAFWELAQKEVEERGLDTCSDQLGKGLVEGYHRSQMDYCIPPGKMGLDLIDNNSSAWEVASGEKVEATRIVCSPVHRDDFTKWWPYPAAPCVSTNMRTVVGEEKRYRAVGCRVTDDGMKLNNEMDREKFIGTSAESLDVDDKRGDCKERIEHTMVLIPRQDQWNPFHVSEDLITTMVSLFISARTAPHLINTRMQLVFTDNFDMDRNHFTPLWDRIGAWAPRRLRLDPWNEGECFTNAIHSVGAGASLLSAMGVGSSYTCASTITWAASHYYRHLFGLLPPSLSAATNEQSSDRRKPINLLWLSREKLDRYAQSHNDWSTWRGVRHINNEKEFISTIREGMKSLCEEGSESAAMFGDAGCVFEDARDTPETWASTTLLPSDPVPIRFAAIDPSVHALETQIHYTGHASILLSPHSGAAGLSLFLPPGEGVIVELQVDSVVGNYHFEHMAKEMGHRYETVGIDRTVDSKRVWFYVKNWLEKLGAERA